MTDKEIIIDGVNVEECSALDENKRCNGMYTCDGEICDYKFSLLQEQLQRKTQECEEYKKTHKYNNTEFKQERDSLIQEIQYKNHYKQALKKIEYIAKENDDLLQGYHLERANNKLILEIIDELKPRQRGK